MEHIRIESKNDVMNFLCANRDRLHALGVMRIGLFGSYVRGEQQAGSDVDLLVEFEAGRKSLVRTF
jgi:predicted nucleotidyltransferase